jgi:WD40 repeat protein
MMIQRYFIPIGILALAATNCYAALPGESELPRTYAAPKIELPSESELPRSTQLAQSEQLDALPAENLLPPDIDAAAPDPAGPLPLAGSPDGIPWLRLNLRGHTAPIRAIKFTAAGDRLCTAGEDKSVIVWLHDPRSERWQYERTIRWQVQRGTRGRIYALAAAPGLLAIGGEGAMGGTGEIVLVDPTTGDFVATLFDEQHGHRQVIVALDFVETPTGPALASQSMDGRTLLWAKNEQGLWRALVVLPDDRANVEAQLAERLLRGRAFSSIVALDNHHVIVPVYQAIEKDQIAWRLEVIDVTNGSRMPLGGNNSPPHWNSVSALATDATHSKLVSADAAGRIYLWDLKTNPATVWPPNRPQPTQVLSLDLSPDGKTLVIGFAGSGDVEIWDLADIKKPRLKSKLPADQHVLATAVDANGDIAFANGNAVIVSGTTASSPRQALYGTVNIPLRVAFSSKEPLYRIGIGTQRVGDSIPLNATFDTDQLRFTRTADQNENDWLPTDNSNGWRIIEVSEQGQGRVWYLEQNGTRRARLPLIEARTGAFRSVIWIDNDNNKPALAAIGTSAGGILVIKLTAEGEAPLLRRLRGHSSDVLSLAISKDHRWLVSGSNDATVCVWPLGDIENEPPSVNHWGATFAVDDAGKLVVETICEDGPLYFRGARQGDELVSCGRMRNGTAKHIVEPQAIIAALNEAGWDEVIEFEFRTGRQASRRFQILPAWQQLVSLVSDSDGEWAYWAPSGYYDASFEGHRLFGWQINRGLAELPDFFLAAQFRGVLERPEIMSRLLHSGTIEAAFRAARLAAPTDSAQTIANTYRLKPEVQILPLDDDKPLADQKLQARVRMPVGQIPARVKAFANGVVAPAGKLVDRQSNGSDEWLTYEWDLAVPSDPRILVQVIAATDDEVTASDQIVWPNVIPAQARTQNRPALDSRLRGNDAIERVARKPRLFLLAAGIDDYRDAQIPKLKTPVAHLRELTDLLQTKSSGLYNVEAATMLNDRATPAAWAILTSDSAEILKEQVSPDDLVVIYLSGHGVQDSASDQFHFVTASADYGDVMAGSYTDCLSLGELAPFMDISCRKLIVLDTCHGGAIQPLRHREMKLAVRALQQDLLITLAASDGTEEAVEGRFSTRLLEGLNGAADQHGNGDGIVRLDELIEFIKQSVADDSARDTFKQTPSVGPIDLVPYVAPPLSEVPAARDSLGVVE